MPALLGQLARDVRHAFRSIRRMPGVAAVVIGSLAIGIGVNSTIFSWIQTQLWKPIAGAPDSSSFVLIEPVSETGGYVGVSWPEYRDLRAALPSFRSVVAFRMAPFNVGDNDGTERRFGLFVSSNYFAALGLTPAAGQFPASSDETAATDPVAVISYDYWKAQFGGRDDVVGRPIRLNDRPFTIVAVTPPNFIGTITGLTFDIFAPATTIPIMSPGSRELENRAQRGYQGIGALASGASRATAQRDLDRAMASLAAAYPASNKSVRGEVLPFSQSPRGPQRMLIGALVMLQVVMLLLLLVVCGNTANLLLARVSARQREVGVRLALGSGRARVVSLLLCESLIMSIAGALLGALLAVWGTEALRAVPFPTPMGIKVQFQTGVDATTLLFAVGLGIVSAAIFGVAPALQLARQNTSLALRASAGVGGRARMRDVLMVVEVALAMIVLIVASLFVQSFNETQSTDPGFRRQGILLAAYDLTGRNQPADSATSLRTVTQLLDRFRTVAGLARIAIASSIPLDIHGMPMRFFSVEGHARADGELDQAPANTVTPGYFETLDVPFVEGATFVDLADVSTAPQVVVNQAFVKRFVPEGAAIGRRIESGGRQYTICGVVKTTLSNAFGEPPTPALYFSYRDRPSSQGELHLRATSGDGTQLSQAARQVVRDLDPTLPIFNVRTLSDHVERNLVFRRIPARMFTILGPLLLVLASSGIYAVVAYGVSRRRKEIAMRLALGATSGRVVGEIVGDTLRVVAIGATAGWAVALLIDREVSAGAGVNVTLFAGVPLLLLAVAALACWWPASRAGRIDPFVALKQD